MFNPHQEKKLTVHTIGVIINPIAGMGGRVGLKGTDGAETFQDAITLGASPIAEKRAITTLQALIESSSQQIQWIVGPGLMGENVVKKLKQPFSVIYPSGHAPSDETTSRFWKIGETTSEDTQKIAIQMKPMIDLLIFFGGDGTAADVAVGVNQEVPTIGVPTGVKMFSAVFALTPQAAIDVIQGVFRGETTLQDRDVLDIDEQAYREGRLVVDLKGILRVPVLAQLVQNSKEGSSPLDDETENQQAIARTLVEGWDAAAIYILGPGSTVAAVASELGVPKTLLGIDVIQGTTVLVADAREQQLIDVLNQFQGIIYLVLSPIGHQGFLLGRGNQQISPLVLHRVPKENIIVLATTAKKKHLSALYVDTGDESLNQKYRGYHRIITDYRQEELLIIK